MSTVLRVAHHAKPPFPSSQPSHRWTTHNSALMSKFEGFDVHGGPPLVLVPSHLSPDGQAHYLGIMHHIER